MNEREAAYILIQAGHAVCFLGHVRIYNAGHEVFVVKDFMNGKTHNFPSEPHTAIDKYFSLIADYAKEKRDECNRVHQG